MKKNRENATSNSNTLFGCNDWLFSYSRWDMLNLCSVVYAETKTL